MLTQPKRNPPNPCKGIIISRGWTLKDVAAEVGCSPNLFYEVVNKRRASWPALRARVAEVLEVPENECFTDVVSTNDSAA